MITYLLDSKRTSPLLKLEKYNVCCVWDNWPIWAEKVRRQRVAYGAREEDEAACQQEE